MKRTRRSTARAAAVELLVGGLLLGGAVPAALAAGRADTLTVMNPATNHALRSGGSHTEWALRLPAGAACSGDSARKAFFVYTFVAPVAVDLAALTFRPANGPVAPAGAVVWPLVDGLGSPYVSRNTAASTGQVLSDTRFNWSHFSLDGAAGAPLPVGRYNIGLACWDTLGRRVDRIWSTAVTFTGSPSDANGEVWQAEASALAATHRPGRTRTWLVIGIVPGAVLAAAAVVLRRRQPVARSESPNVAPRPKVGAGAGRQR